jgi:hypothetical protein
MTNRITLTTPRLQLIGADTSLLRADLAGATARHKLKHARAFTATNGWNRPWIKDFEPTISARTVSKRPAHRANFPSMGYLRRMTATRTRSTACVHR